MLIFLGKQTEKQGRLDQSDAPPMEIFRPPSLKLLSDEELEDVAAGKTPRGWKRRRAQSVMPLATRKAAYGDSTRIRSAPRRFWTDTWRSWPYPTRSLADHKLPTHIRHGHRDLGLPQRVRQLLLAEPRLLHRPPFLGRGAPAAKKI